MILGEFLVHVREHMMVFDVTDGSTSRRHTKSDGSSHFQSVL